MAPHQWPLVTLKVTLTAWSLSNYHTLGNIAHVKYNMLHVNWKAYTACNFNSYIETEGLLKVAGRHVHCESDKSSETLQDSDAVTTNL